MRITESQLRRIIREELTVGDLRDALAAAKGKKIAAAAKEMGKTAAKKGAMSILGLIPGATSIVGAIETGMEIKDLYDAATSINPEEKKSNPLWDFLTIDSDTSQIVDDAVEQKFVKDIADRVQGMPADSKLPNIDTQLNNWLSKNYNNSKISKGSSS